MRCTRAVSATTRETYDPGDYLIGGVQHNSPTCNGSETVGIDSHLGKL